MPTPTMQSKLPTTATSIFSVMSALANEHQAINLSQGFPNFDPPQALRDLVYKHMQSGHNQYAPMPGLPLLRQALSQKHYLQSGYAPDVDTEITITAGATQALYTAITAMVQPGDEAIILEPAYDSYRPAIELSGGKVIAYQLEGPDYRVHWDDFAQLITAKTRLIILNTPHNPTGSIWRQSDWQALERLVANTPIFILSDEVYEQLVYDGEKHWSLLDFPALFERGMATFSFGKTFHNTGWKMGYCVGTTAWMQEFRKIHQFNVFSVNTPAQYALAEYVQDADNYQHLHAFYQQKRDHLLSAIAGASLRPLNCEGTYFQLFDYSAIQPNMEDTEFCRWLTTDIGVAAIPVSAFRSVTTEERMIRLCFAKTEDVLDAAVGRLKHL